MAFRQGLITGMCPERRTLTCSKEPLCTRLGASCPSSGAATSTVTTVSVVERMARIS